MTPSTSFKADEADPKKKREPGLVRSYWDTVSLASSWWPSVPTGTQFSSLLVAAR